MNRTVKSYVKARNRLSKKNKLLLNTSPTKFFFKDKDFQNFKFLNPEQKNILEIGFGDGENLLNNARKNLDSFYIGIEVYEMGVVNVLNIAETEGIDNLKVILGDAVDVLEKNNHFSCFDEVIIFFPDPWPKRKHNKRRLISENFLMNIKKIMRENGTLRIKTDWQDYADEIEIYLKKVFKNYKEAADQKLDSITKYEKIALAEKRKISYFEVY